MFDPEHAKMAQGAAARIKEWQQDHPNDRLNREGADLWNPVYFSLIERPRAHIRRNRLRPPEGRNGYVLFPTVRRWR
jgi:hypothetical protein